ncbi:MAG: hypothetical protein Q8M95_00775 [Candidatus Methanoperedens sp.]|nr:hypothetical protein [Candidatus Methanoperedens sp.]
MTVKEFLLKYSKELSEKYFGKYIAIAEDQIAAVSESVKAEQHTFVIG